MSERFAGDVVDDVLGDIVNAVKKSNVQIICFVTFRVASRNARTGRKSKVRKTGSGSHFRGSNEPWVASDDLSEAGLCDTTNNRSERLRLGIIKPNGGRALIRKVPFSWTYSGGCQVSDDGSTVATVSAKARHRTLVALHHGRLIKVKLNSGLKHVVGISPSGRFALVQSQDPNYGQSGKIQRAAIVDLYHHKVRLLRGVWN